MKRRTHITALLTAALLLGCGKHSQATAPAAVNAALSAKYATYVNLAPQGWYDSDCDGLLFKSLLNAGAGRTFPVEQARADDGHWLRTPPPAPCSPTSRDMHLGLWWYILAQHRADLADQEFGYAEAHAFVMDSGAAAISLLLPDEINTLAVVEHKIGGADHVVRLVPTVCTSHLTGFEAHLQALVIGLRELAGAGDPVNQGCIDELAGAQPDNAFFSAISGLYSGDQSHTIDLLLNPTLFPPDRLPTSADRCEPWLWQRDENTSDWQPCPAQAKTHSGGDFLIAAAIVLGKV